MACFRHSNYGCGTSADDEGCGMAVVTGGAAFIAGFTTGYLNVNSVHGVQ